MSFSHRNMLVRMPSLCKLGLCVALIIFPSISRAANITLEGHFTADDGVQLFNISIAAPGSVDIRSYGYAGGTTSTGVAVPRGGFDSILTLFNASGVFIDDDDEGAGVATDPLTGLAADARLTETLAPGSYIVALTEYDNFSIGNLAAGFAEAGNPNFTADSTFSTAGPCPGNMFRDISGTTGRCRTGNWTVDFVNVSSVTPAAPVPEPSTLLLLGLGCALLLIPRCRRNRKTTALACVVVAALACVQMDAQTASGPDYSNVSDFLNGQRTLLKVTDLTVTAYDQRLGHFYSNTITTSNSQQTFQGQTETWAYARSVGPSFTARMYNGAGTSITVGNYDVNTFGAQPYLDLLFQTGINPANIYIYRPLGAGDNPTVTDGAAADFTLNGYQELALALNDGRLLIVAPNDVNNLQSYFHQTLTQLDTLSALATGDFRGDGQKEIAGLSVQPNGGLKLVIYTVDPVTLAVTRAPNSLILTTPGASPGTPIHLVSMANGRFNSAGHDQLVVAFATSSGPATVEVIDFAPNTLSAVEGPSCSPAGNITFPGGYFQVKTGKFGLPNNPYDQIVYHSSSGNNGGRFFEVLTVNSTNLNVGGTTPVTYDQYACAIGIQIGNFDHREGTGPDLNDQIAFLYCNGETDASGNPGSTMNIYSVDNASLNVNGQPDSILDLTGKLVPGGSRLTSWTFAATDLQDRSLLLGEPLVVDLANRDEPSVVLAVPPMHVDFVSPDPVDGVPPTVLNLSVVPDKFTNTYQNSTSDEHPHSESQKTSWSWGATESVNYSFYVGDIESTGYTAGDKFTAAQKLKGSVDKTSGTFQSHSFGFTAFSVLDDVVEHKENDLRVWVYPVVGQTVCPASKPNCQPGEKVPLTIQFSAPTSDAPPQESAGSTLSWYQPPWEPGNIFSYPANLAQLQSVYPGSGTCPGIDGPINQTNTALCTLAEGNGFATDNTGLQEDTTWTVTSTSGTTTNFNQNYTFENDFSVTASAGEKGAAGASITGEFDLSGSFGFSHLTNDSTTLGTSTGLIVNVPGTFLTPVTNYEYQATPYILGTVVAGGVVDNQQLSTGVNTFGLVRAVFTADPVNAGHWWSQAYEQAPDVALNHPTRWIITRPSVPSGNFPSNCLATSTGGGSSANCAELNERAPDNPWLSAYHQMRGFFISSANSPGQGPQLESAKVNDVLTLQARVYNYSLKAMDPDTEVHVRFYFTPWNGTVAAGPSVLINEVVSNPIPPFNDTEGAPPNWVLVPTTFDTSKFAETKTGNVSVVFWVVVWTQDKSGNILKEMPGHGLTAIPPAGATDPVTQETTTTFADVAAFEECQPPDQDGKTNCHSNNLGLYPQIFYIASESLGAAPGSPKATLNLGKLQISANRVTPRDNVVLTTTVLATDNAALGVSVNFYDGDPAEGGRLIAVQRIPHIAEDDPYQVQALFRSNTCGVHQLFAVVNRGRLNEVIRRAHPVRVACNATQ